jgi:hypothetical protein
MGDVGVGELPISISHSPLDLEPIGGDRYVDWAPRNLTLIMETIPLRGNFGN